jgi:hypothetical protein
VQHGPAARVAETAYGATGDSVRAPERRTVERLRSRRYLGLRLLYGGEEDVCDIHVPGSVLHGVMDPEQERVLGGVGITMEQRQVPARVLLARQGPVQHLTNAFPPGAGVGHCYVVDVPGQVYVRNRFAPRCLRPWGEAVCKARQVRQPRADMGPQRFHGGRGPRKRMAIPTADCCGPPIRWNI